jgi:DNA-directed RNA polymerase specialized sigma24 family protein
VIDRPHQTPDTCERDHLDTEGGCEARGAGRAARTESSLPGEQVDFDARAPADQRSVEDRVERVARSAEIMRRLKRDEARALILKAEGLSYVEMAERLGWTYTNQCS